MMRLLLCLLMLGGLVLSQDFNWKAFEGQRLLLLLPEHPYQKALVTELESFTELTGIQIDYEVFPLKSYFDEVTLDLARGKSSRHDLLMIDVYHIWQFAPAGWLEKLEPYLKDKTHPDYHFEDVLRGLQDSTRWNLEAGRPNLGQGSQYALPLAFEASVLRYQKALFSDIPQTLDEFLEDVARLKETHPEMLLLGQTQDWESLDGAFISLYAGYGCRDFDDAMVAQVNSPCAAEVTRKWLDLMHMGQDWEGSDSDKARDMLAAEKVAVFIGMEQVQELELAFAPLPGNHAHVRLWSLAMNARSKQKEAAWLFLQWITSAEVLSRLSIEKNVLNPVRASIWQDPSFQQRVADLEGYLETYTTIMSKDMRVQFSPHGLFFDTVPAWAEALQDIYDGADLQTRLDELSQKLNDTIQKARAMR